MDYMLWYIVIGIVYFLVFFFFGSKRPDYTNAKVFKDFLWGFCWIIFIVLLLIEVVLIIVPIWPKFVYKIPENVFNFIDNIFLEISVFIFGEN